MLQHNLYLYENRKMAILLTILFAILCSILYSILYAILFVILVAIVFVILITILIALGIRILFLKIGPVIGLKNPHKPHGMPFFDPN